LQDNSDNCVSYAEDLALIKEAVLAAGQIAKDAFNANDSKVWDKSNNSPVTDADIAVNDYLLETLCAARPGYGWLSEETKDDHSRHACPRTFVVDPIDGTRAFIDRTPNFAVSVAIIQDGQSIAGVVFNPLKDEIACGKADATVAFTPKSDWDVAAAALIASEAGAIVTNLHGATPSYDGESTSGLGIICAGKSLHALLLARVTPVIAQFEKSDDKVKDFGFMGTSRTDRKLKETNMSDTPNMQLLHLVIGGELVDPNKTEFKDLTQVDFVGAYANFADAKAAWKSAAQRTVDNAHMRYFVLHAHELIDPDKDGIIG